MLLIQPGCSRRQSRNAVTAKPLFALGAVALALAIMTAPAFAVMVTIHNDAMIVRAIGDDDNGVLREIERFDSQGRSVTGPITVPPLTGGQTPV